MSGRVKGKPRASQVEMGQRTLLEFEEAQRRREAREQQATREQLERAARLQGWTIREEQSRASSRADDHDPEEPRGIRYVRQRGRERAELLA